MNDMKNCSKVKQYLRNVILIKMSQPKMDYIVNVRFVKRNII